MKRLMAIVLTGMFAAVSVTPALAQAQKDQKKEQKQQDKKGPAKKNKK